MAIFDKKTWNDAVFQKYLKKVPNLKENSLLKNGVLVENNSLRARLVDGVGGNTLIEPIKGRLDGAFVNYDGATKITTTARGTFHQTKIVAGRAKGWEEKDFSTELTGVNWMEGVAGEVAEYYQDVDMGDLLAILKGIFSMSDTAGADFVESHTYEVDDNIDATTINAAAQKAFGDKKKFVSMAFMHSRTALTLENLQILDYLKYTDSNGITSNIDIAQQGNKVVIIDDSMPILHGYEEATSASIGAILVVSNSSTPGAGEIKLNAVKASDFYPEDVQIGDYLVEGRKYVTYLLGKGAFEYSNIGAKVPSEVDRDPATDGGVDMLYTRQRKLYAPAYISWAGSGSIISPMPSDFENGSNWEIVNDGSSPTKTYVDHRLIPFGRIITRED